MDEFKWHILTGEFPPRPGGVSDYTMQLSQAIAVAGGEVHVWCPADGVDTGVPGVFIHNELGSISPRDLRRVGRLVDGFPRPRRLLVQWVPHAFGYRSMNVHFCLWLLKRSTFSGDRIDVMVHEPFLRFSGPLSHRAAALVHRLMTIILLGAAVRVWVSIPAWGELLAPYMLGHRGRARWLPIPSNIVPVDDEVAVSKARARITLAPILIGHFGTYGPGISMLLNRVILDVLRADPAPEVLLLGRRGPEFRAAVVEEAPDLGDRIHALGPLGASELSVYLQTCDVMVQPFSDGISTRRTTVMACLAHGLPVVSTTGESSEPLWTEQNAVSLVPQAEPTRLASEVLAILAEKDRRTAMGKAARRLYDSQFDMRHVVAKLLADV